jgi:excinuclease UvrABC nuclease subunit
MNKPKNIDTRNFHIYRMFDKDGVLLYIGMSKNALFRLIEHSTMRGWGDEIYSLTIERVGKKIDAIKREKEAIFNEKPKYNKKHQDHETNRRIRRCAVQKSGHGFR